MFLFEVGRVNGMSSVATCECRLDSSMPGFSIKAELESSLSSLTPDFPESRREYLGLGSFRSQNIRPGSSTTILCVVRYGTTGHGRVSFEPPRFVRVFMGAREKWVAEVTFAAIEKASGGTKFADADVNSKSSRTGEPAARSVDTDNSTGRG